MTGVGVQTAEGALAAAQEAHGRAQRRLQCARADLEKRIQEHDTCVAEGRAATLVAVTLQMIKEQEAAVAQAAQEAQACSTRWCQHRETGPTDHSASHQTDVKGRRCAVARGWCELCTPGYAMQVAMEALTSAKQSVRQQQADAAGGDAAAPGQVVRIKELDDIVSGRGVAVSGTAPSAGGLQCAMAVIDTSSRAPLFFRCDPRVILFSHARRVSTWTPRAQLHA